MLAETTKASCIPLKFADSMIDLAVTHIAIAANHGQDMARTSLAKSSLKIAATASAIKGFSFQKYSLGGPSSLANSGTVAAAKPSAVSDTIILKDDRVRTAASNSIAAIAKSGI